MKTEIKTFQLKKLTVSEADGTFEGYAATFGNIDLGDDVILSGAFKRTLKNNKGKIPILDSHNQTKQIGWNLEASEDARGLYVKGHLNLEVQAAKEKYALLKQAASIGARAGLSIGFRIVKADRDPAQNQIRRLKELQLIEYSVVTFPMNPQASVTAVKYLSDIHQEFLLNEMGLDEESAKRITEQTKSLLESSDPDTHSDEEGPDNSKTLEALKSFSASLKKNFKE